MAGQINIRRLESGGGPRLVLQVATNEPDLLLDVNSDEELQAMKITVPKKYSASIGGQQPCIEMKATVWVPGGKDIGCV